MKDANHSKRAQAVIQAVEFHPSASVVLTAGLHKTLSLFQIDGENNSLLQSIFLQRFPILTAHFTASGEEVIMAWLLKNIGSMFLTFWPERSQ